MTNRLVPAWRLGCALAMAVALALSAVGAGAEAEAPAPQAATGDAPPLTTPKDWEVAILGYGWMPGVSSTVSAGGITKSINVSFSDIFQKLGWAGMAATEVRYQRALLLVDVIGQQLADSDSVAARSLPFQKFANGPGDVLTVGPIDAAARLTMWMVDTKVGLRAYSTPTSAFLGDEEPGDRRRVDLDLFAGARYWYAKTSASVDVDPATLTVGGVPVDPGSRLPDVNFGGGLSVGGNLLRGGYRSASNSTWWVDPLLGARVRGDVTDSVNLFLLTDIGGFGIGSASKFTYQAVAGLNWALSEHWSAVLAFRALGFVRSGTVESTEMYGPMVGLGLRF